MARRKSASPKSKQPTLATAPGQIPEEKAELRAFALDFFRQFGAEISETSRTGSSVQVSLPPDLAEHFEKPYLQLVFHNTEVASDQDLVAYGSRLFDRMMTYLDRQGAATVQALPNHFSGGEELLQAIKPVNAAITKLTMAEQNRRLFVFNWHITYRADDKREELYTVLMQENGVRVEEIRKGQPGQKGIPSVDLEQLLADAHPLPPRLNEEGIALPPDLPPMTQLTQLSENARKYAIYHADLRCVEHEREILPRLHKVLSRLTTYYEEQIQEVYESHDPTGEKRQALEADLARKVAEEVENHRLRVQIRLFSYAILHLPVAVADITLGQGNHEVTAQVLRNRYTGAITRPRCHACDQETVILAIDRNGHITCDDCLKQCASCQDILCATCGVATCPVCRKENCESCSVICWACGERACQEHADPCPTCGDMVCLSCQAECAECGQRQCQSHLRADSVTGQLICTRCAVRCPGCQQLSAQTDQCEQSGQRFCTSCLQICADCGKRVGPGFYHTDAATGKQYCHECARTCPACGVFTLTAGECTVCGQICCPSCGAHCAMGGELLCSQHAVAYPDCDHRSCQTHQAHCGVGQEILCPVCAHTCAICQRPHCEEHTAHCTMCQQAYCAECVRRSGYCDTCATLEREGVSVHLEEEAIAAHEQVRPLVGSYRWVRGQNQDYTIYLGHGALGVTALIVTRKNQLLRVRRLSLVDRLLGRSWS